MQKTQTTLEFGNLFKEIKNKNLIRWMDRLTFPKILLIWAVIIILFGVVYAVFQNGDSLLLNNQEDKGITSLKDSVYFSFITATTTGFGDIIPVGFFKFIAVIEVVFGLLLLAFVTSKLVSIKQDAILSEVYELSFNEKINRIRSSLILFRQNIERVINKIDENSISKRNINNLYVYISSLEEIINELMPLILKQKGSTYYTKSIDSVNTELILNSILNSFDKLYELICLMKQNKIEWRSEVNILVLHKCIDMNETLFNQAALLKLTSKEKLNDITPQKNKIISLIKNEIEKKSE